MGSRGISFGLPRWGLAWGGSSRRGLGVKGALEVCGEY